MLKSVSLMMLIAIAGAVDEHRSSSGAMPGTVPAQSPQE